MSRKFIKHYSQSAASGDPVLGDTFGWKVGAASNSTDLGYAPGGLLIDVTNADVYVNSGTKTSPTWLAIAGTTITALTITTATITTANVTTLVTNSIGGGGSTVAFTDRITTTDGVASGTARVVGGLAYINVAASTAVASTSAETAYDTAYTIPANTLKAGTTVRVRLWGTMTTVVGSDTMAYKVYLGGIGGTALITSAATTGVNAQTFVAEAELVVRTAGATGTAVSIGTYKVNSAEGTFTVKDDAVASFTINTTTALAIAAAVTYNTTNANSSRVDILRVDIV